jgi:2-C-methyl-D-erythritol 4-phosphate cytidylyltransferase
MRTTALVLAAGEGRRFSPTVSKLLLFLGGRPVLCWSLGALQRHPGIDEIVVVTSAPLEARVRRLTESFGFSKVSAVVCGGRRRQDSVRAGLNARDATAGFVLIHDGARPFLSQEMISSVLAACRECGAAVTAVPVKATIKDAAGSTRAQELKSTRVFVRRTLDRRRLWEVQTPQAFEAGLLAQAFRRFGSRTVTDDASLVERLGRKVRIVPGSYCNIKITTPEDALIAQALVEKKVVCQRRK